MRRKTALLLAAATMVGTSAVTAPAPAEAAWCGPYGVKSADATWAYNIACSYVQARIDRYSAGYPKTYLGSWAKEISHVHSTVGTNSGNYVRAQIWAGVFAWERV